MKNEIEKIRKQITPAAAQQLEAMGIRARGPEIEEGLKLGFEGVAAEFMFIAEEPEEFAGFEGPRRHPFFVRLVWNPRQDMWRLVEAFAPNDAPVLFLFNST